MPRGETSKKLFRSEVEVENEDKLDNSSEDQITGIDVVDGVLTVRRRDGSVLERPLTSTFTPTEFNVTLEPSVPGDNNGLVLDWSTASPDSGVGYGFPDSFTVDGSSVIFPEGLWDVSLQVWPNANGTVYVAAQLFDAGLPNGYSWPLHGNNIDDSGAAIHSSQAVVAKGVWRSDGSLELGSYVEHGAVAAKALRCVLFVRRFG